MSEETPHTQRPILSALSGKGLFAVTVWGASFVATRIALQSLNPFGLIALRLAAGTLLLALVIRARGGRLLPARADVPVCTFLGIMLAAHLLIQAYGLRYTTAIHTGWIIGFIPVTIALGAQFLRQQRLDGKGWLGVILGTAGVLLVTLTQPPNFADAHFGDLLQIVSCLTWTVYTLAAVSPIARNGVLCVTAFGMGIAAIISGVATIWTGILIGPPTREALLSVAFLGFVCSGVAYYMWFAAQRDHGPARVGSLLYIEPFVTLAIAVAPPLREPVTANTIIGGLIVLCGVWLVAKGTRKPTPPASPE